MTTRTAFAWLLCAVLSAPSAGTLAAPKPKQERARQAPNQYSHQFGLIGHGFAYGGAEAQLEQALAAARDPALAFVVATGIKAPAEPCSDALYLRRRELFEQARRPVVVLPAASDWTGCMNGAGRTAALERLNRMRELFYAEPVALGTHTLALTRLSTTVKFRSYAENAHWVVGKVLYATLNLPSDNNHYRQEAGRNSEFEDRTVANRFWINRLFTVARRLRMEAVVLFSEGDVKILSEKPGLLALLRRTNTPQGQDGYAEVRRNLLSQATRFGGKVLLVDTAALASGADPAIAWRDNIGHLSIGPEALKVTVQAGSEEMFVLDKPKAQHELAVPK
jgi:hypothetical protein